MYRGRWAQVSSCCRSPDCVTCISEIGQQAAQRKGSLHSCRCCRAVPVLLLSEDWNPRRLEDGDLHQSAVRLDRLAVVEGNHKQLAKTREYTGDTTKKKKHNSLVVL